MRYPDRGLSYMTFAYDELRLSAQEIEPGDKLQVSIDVTNTGNRVGKEVVKISLRDIASRLQRPNKELKAEASVKLNASKMTMRYGLRVEPSVRLTHKDCRYDEIDRWESG